jgi:cytochrome c-type biogenesis protein CcmH/NrfG
MKKLLLFVALSATAIGVQAKQPVDNLGAQAISAADFSTAETRLTAQLRRDPGLPEALLNLAYVYRATGRGSEARELYARVLARPNLELEGGAKPAWSHDIARLGLARMQSFASR